MTSTGKKQQREGDREDGATMMGSPPQSPEESEAQSVLIPGGRCSRQTEQPVQRPWGGACLGDAENSQEEAVVKL